MQAVRHDAVSVSGSDASAGAVRFDLVVVRGQRLETCRLPEGDRLTIGRDARCDVVIDDPSLAPVHAIAHLGATLQIEAASPTAPTLVRGAHVPLGARVDIQMAEPVTLGGLV